MPIAMEAPSSNGTESFSPIIVKGNLESVDKTGNGQVVEPNQLDTPPLSEPSDSAEANNFFDLKPPPPPSATRESRVEEVMGRLYSEEHLHYILGDQSQFQRFMLFLNRYRPYLVTTLNRYMEMRKTMKAVEYANAVAKKISWPSHSDHFKFSRIDAAQTDVRFEDYANREMNILIAEALPAWITYSLVGVVSDCVTRDITGQTLPVIKELVGNLGEVFCLSDPSQKDNPIIFCSEEFFRMTQYGTNFVINRNCRFLQGPHSDRQTTSRIAKAVSNGQESNELLLNYRRDGTPFINLLMVSPLHDDKGTIRYFMGAQIDVTGLIIDGLGLDSFRGMLQKIPPKNPAPSSHSPSRCQTPTTYNKEKNNFSYRSESLSKLTDLSLMLSPDESEIVTKNARLTISPPPDNESVTSDECSIRSMLPTNKVPRPLRRIIDTQDSELSIRNMALQRSGSNNFRNFPGTYRHYLLIRPYPSLQIIFASPSLRLPGLLRTPFFTKIGGSPNVLSSLEEAFRDGASVTARILWLPKHCYPANTKLRRRWIRCTPLLRSDDCIGVWVVVIVPVDNDEDHSRPISDFGYHSIGRSESVLGINKFANRPQSHLEPSFEEYNDLAAMESLVEGRQSSAIESNGSSSRLRRVTILDHDGDSINQSESSFSISASPGKGSNTILSKRGQEEGVYTQYHGITTASTSIIEEEA